eukprot:365011-Chlamydomonas_euryale.AAC.35
MHGNTAQQPYEHIVRPWEGTLRPAHPAETASLDFGGANMVKGRCGSAAPRGAAAATNRHGCVHGRPCSTPWSPRRGLCGCVLSVAGRGQEMAIS